MLSNSKILACYTSTLSPRAAGVPRRDMNRQPLYIQLDNLERGRTAGSDYRKNYVTLASYEFGILVAQSRLIHWISLKCETSDDPDKTLAAMPGSEFRIDSRRQALRMVGCRL